MGTDEEPLSTFALLLTTVSSCVNYRQHCVTQGVARQFVFCCLSERNSIILLFFPLVRLMILNSSTFWFSYFTETSELACRVSSIVAVCYQVERNCHA